VIGVEPGLEVLLVLFVLATVVRAALQRWQSVNQASVTEEFLHHLRMRLYRAFVRARYDYITRIRMSDFIHGLTDEVYRAGMISHQLISISAQALLTLFFVAVAFRISWEATVVTVVCGGVVFAALWRLTLQSETVGQAMTESTARLMSVTSEHLAGIKTTRSYRAEDATEQAFGSFSHQVGAAGVDASRNYADVSMRFTIASTVLAALVIYVSLKGLSLERGALLLLVIIFSRLVPRVSALQQGLQNLLHALPAYARINQLASDAEAHAEKFVRAPAGGADRRPLTGDIVFTAVNFRYTAGDEDNHVSDVHLRIPHGETTAIIGPSGAGKSTIADLMTGLLTPASGRIEVGNVVLDHDSMDWWRTRLGYVAQDTFLFHDTVRANLSWVRPEAVEADLWQALTAARAAEFVRRLPRGLDTLIGDRGVQLSGGERQRLALARALVRRPDVLILDEATSALDTENERAIYEAIDLLHGTLTMVIITHRLASVRNVDLVYEMRDGRIVASGPPADVLVERGREDERNGS
jgi:ATP-binding cassette subfamily C protein